MWTSVPEASVILDSLGVSCSQVMFKVWGPLCLSVIHISLGGFASSPESCSEQGEPTGLPPAWAGSPCFSKSLPTHFFLSPPLHTLCSCKVVQFGNKELDNLLPICFLPGYKPSPKW